MLVVGFSPKVIAADKVILISEVQTGTEESASQEFIEIYNNGPSEIDISGWSLYYKSATGTSWVKKATINTKALASGEFYVFSANMPGDISYSSTLSQTGGNIQIRDKSGAVKDTLGWGNANSALVQPASESAPGQSMYRIFDFENATMQNTDNNFDDFELAQSATPSKLPEQILPEQEQGPVIYPKIELSELFPNPQSPQSDAIDEFIELFNPTGQDVDISGWKLRDDSGAEYIIKNKIIQSGYRLAIKATESKITLNNTGDTIQLINPNGEVVDESANYGDAQEGLGWIKSSGLWQWAISATPDDSNSEIYVEQQTSPSQAVKNVKKAAKNSTKKPSSSKSKTSKVASSSNSKNNLTSPKEESSKSSNSNLWSWLLVAAGVGTIGYGIYEYRTEIQLHFKKLRSKFGSRS